MRECSDIASTTRRTLSAPFLAVAAFVSALSAFGAYWRISVAPALYDEPVYAQMGWRYVHWNSTAEAIKTNSNFEHPLLAKLLFGLAELLTGHESLTACRAVAATCMLASAAVAGVWIASAVGPWTGLLTGGMVALVPTPIFPQDTSFGRTAMLEPVAELFMIASIALAWYWFHARGRRAWYLAVLTGIATGLAAASKENAFLGIIGPVIVGVLANRRSSNLARVRVGQALVAVVSSVAAFLLTYAPLGSPISKINYLMSYQWAQQGTGHIIGYAGRVSEHPEWWANFWFAWHSLGATVSLTLIAGVLLAVMLRRGLLVWWCVAALTVPVAFHCFLIGNALSYYWALWIPAVFCLAALGISEAFDRLWKLAGSRRNLTVSLLAITLAFLLGMPVIRQLHRVATLPTIGGGAVAALRHNLSLHGDVLMSGTSYPEIQEYMSDGTNLLQYVPRNIANVDTIVIGQPRCRFLVDPAMRALVDINVSKGRLHLAHKDRLISLYVPNGKLIAPNRAQIAAEPIGRLTDSC